MPKVKNQNRLESFCFLFGFLKIVTNSMDVCYVHAIWMKGSPGIHIFRRIITSERIVYQIEALRWRWGAVHLLFWSCLVCTQTTWLLHSLKWLLFSFISHSFVVHFQQGGLIKAFILRRSTKYQNVTMYIP